MFGNFMYGPRGYNLYKWIKATIGFKTACPIPGALWKMDYTGHRPNGRTNASWSDFYGGVDAPLDVNFPMPISEVRPPNGSNTVMGVKDWTRLALDTANVKEDKDLGAFGKGRGV